jgi:hypothetical protein
MVDKNLELANSVYDFTFNKLEKNEMDKLSSKIIYLAQELSNDSTRAYLEAGLLTGALIYELFKVIEIKF